MSVYGIAASSPSAAMEVFEAVMAVLIHGQEAGITHEVSTRPGCGLLTRRGRSARERESRR
jgi:hypothetical protein